MVGSPLLDAAPADPPAADAASFTGLVEAVDWPDSDAAAVAAVAAAAREHDGGGSAGGPGRLGELIEWLAATQGTWPPQPFRRPCVVIDGSCPPAVAALAERAGARVRTIEAAGDPVAAFAAGAAAADREIESGADVVVLVGSTGPDTDDAHTAAAVVVALLTGAEPVALLPRGPAAIDSAAWITRADRIRAGRRLTATLRGRPEALLSAAGSSSFAAAAGVVLQAAARRTPVILDGTPAVAAGLLCSDHQLRVIRWLQVADSSPDPVHSRAVADLRLRPVLDLNTGGDGTAGLLALDLLAGAATTAGADAGAAADTDADPNAEADAPAVQA